MSTQRGPSWFRQPWQLLLLCLQPQSLPSELPDPDIAARLHFECHGQPVLGLRLVAAAGHQLLHGILYVLLLVAVSFPLALSSFDFS